MEEYWLIGLDVGYSSVKAFLPNCVVSFPSFAQRRAERVANFGEPKFSDIFYQNEKDGSWGCGRSREQFVGCKRYPGRTTSFLQPDNVRIIFQPMGAYFSACMGDMEHKIC